MSETTKQPEAQAESAWADSVQRDGSASLSDRELVNEILACLRINMMRETMTTQNDEVFWRFINTWSEGHSVLRTP